MLTGRLRTFSHAGANWSRCRSKSTKSLTEYEFLEHSSLRTFKFQKSLPQLPVPKLDKTCERYLAALRPIIDDNQQFENTVKIVNEFQSGPGAALHQQLVEKNKQNKGTSYVTEPWFDMYLESRLPLPLNYNPFMSWKDDPKAEYNVQSLRAANFIVSAMRFKKSLQKEVLYPEVFHMNPAKSDTDSYRRMMRWSPEFCAFYASALYQAYPLDMSQFKNLFNSTRIPCLGKDVLKTWPNSTHVAVLKGGQFYVFDTHDKSGHLKSPAEIHDCVKCISQLKREDKWDSITMFSTDDRDQWARVRQQLTRNQVNQQSLDSLDSASFVICLDDVEFDTNLVQHAHNFLHGYGGQQFPLNRWFDKSFSIILTKDGRAAINFEHSWGDGVAVLRFFNEVYNDSSKNHFAKSKLASNESKDGANEHVHHLEFQFDEFSRNAHRAAESRYREATSSLNIDYILYESMNQEYFKKKKVSPDSMFQLAFQMAFAEVYNYTPATYESCSTSAFKHGRTETVRPATAETKKTVKAFNEKTHSATEMRLLLSECSKKHFQLTKEAATGQGFDRHLYVMKTLAMANEKNKNLPDLYLDKSYLDANHIILSTSTLRGECFAGGAFAPVTQDGYGLGYGFFEGGLGLVCSSYKNQRDGKQLTEAFKHSMHKINAILKRTG